MSTWSSLTTLGASFTMNVIKAIDLFNVFLIKKLEALRGAIRKYEVTLRLGMNLHSLFPTGSAVDQPHYSIFT